MFSNELGYANNVYTTKGYRDWKHHKDRFNDHLLTEQHKKCALLYANRMNPEKHIDRIIDKNLSECIKKNRKCLKIILESILFLGNILLKLFNYKK
jgi:hypothetical protein